ncbi:MAG: type I methionyl aminopeptidase [Alphaproteobacteria bacterium]|nr:type I methionyl aminopeptidase [Alphaproteobacteria bacterium]
MSEPSTARLARQEPGIPRLSREEFAGMRKAGRLAADTLDHAAGLVRPGVSTGFLDAACHEFIVGHGGTPAPLHYKGFPKSICTSVNHVVCHGIPGDKVLHDGGIVNIDVTVIVDGWHGDSSRMYFAGHVGRKAARLCDATYEAMMCGIAAVRPGATTGDIGHAIRSFAEHQRTSVVRDFCGHGIGRIFQGAEILHYGEPGDGIPLVEGMCFTVEPMLNAGRPEVRMLPDGWTAVTRDKSLSAQFEHTIGVTADGREIFTRSAIGRDRPPYGG